MLWLNASEHDCSVTLPLNDWVQQGAVVLSTDPENPVGQPVKAGQTITVSARSLVLLQES
jgi:glycogen operon protein